LDGPTVLEETVGKEPAAEVKKTMVMASLHNVLLAKQSKHTSLTLDTDTDTIRTRTETKKSSDGIDQHLTPYQKPRRKALMES
jgi:hypothetical protein